MTKLNLLWIYAKKIFLILFSIFLLTGCNQQNQEIITFSTWGSVTEIQVLKKIISDFEKENPNIKVELLHIPQNYFQKLHLLFASNTAPDVVFINNLNLPIYAKYLEDLSDCIDQKDYFPSSISSLSFENKILAIPRDISNLVFYINLDKIPMPNRNWTLDDLKKILISNKQLMSFEHDIYWALPYLAYFGNVDLTDGLNENELEGINFYNSLQNGYKIVPTKSEVGSSTLAQMFLDKKISLYLSGRWMFPKISEKADFNWAIINFPYGKSKQTCDASGWAITKNSGQKNNAKKFVKYLSKNKNYQYFAETGLIVPAKINTAQYLNNTKHNEKQFLDVINHSKPTAVNKNYKEIADKINLKYFNK